METMPYGAGASVRDIADMETAMRSTRLFGAEPFRERGADKSVCRFHETMVRGSGAMRVAVLCLTARLAAAAEKIILT